ncbi:TANK-binding kinase 1-binding protein 1 isoform X3 [Rhinatrema bivittatum]|uniref:TANK-binding kinase 1-binding protein 1 isoform X3 n=1 Tax=Rhinatrema bivittatum TaxID=194408 RepID=UPI0011290CDB|nr:TANK-binding kinase 1-binding protein 1 isoform X3 [Rhinatrema bivittatum]
MGKQRKWLWICETLPNCRRLEEVLSAAMDSVFEDDISILTQERLCQDGEWIDSPNPDLSSNMCSASHFALITAYEDIKVRLMGLERENANLKRKLKLHEGKYSVFGEFVDDWNIKGYDTKEYSLLKMEKASLQQQFNQYHDERDMLDSPMNRIRSVEQQIRQQESNSFQKQQNKELQFLSVRASPGQRHGELCQRVLDRSLGLQSSRSLDETCDLEVRRLEVELQVVRRELQSSQLKEVQLKEECRRLESELKQLQEAREEELVCSESQRDMAWLKKVGDDQVNLALAYTELTEELSRLRSLSLMQSQILRSLLQEQPSNAGQRHSSLPHHHSPTSQRRSPAPQCQSPAQQCKSPVPHCQSPVLQRRSPTPSCQSPILPRRSPVPLCQSPVIQCRSPTLPIQSTASQHQSPVSSCPSPVLQHRSPSNSERSITDLAYSKPSSHHIKAGFQGRRSYSEVSDAALYPQPCSVWLQPEIATLPTHCSYSEYMASACGSLSPRDLFQDPLQSSDEEDWTVPSPPSPDGGAIRCASFCAGFPIPDTPASRSTASYSRTEHAQSWPSINLLMEAVDSDIRSCPLCQAAFPVGYPDDALIKHIDSHLENNLPQNC